MLPPGVYFVLIYIRDRTIIEWSSKRRIVERKTGVNVDAVFVLKVLMSEAPMTVSLLLPLFICFVCASFAYSHFRLYVVLLSEFLVFSRTGCSWLSGTANGFARFKIHYGSLLSLLSLWATVIFIPKRFSDVPYPSLL